jgi:hypothetical protein
MDIIPVLFELGLKDVRQRGEEITALCPMHERNLGRPDRNASWGINVNSGLHQCFSCGYRGTVASLYYDLTGVMPGPELMAGMVVGQFLNSFAEPEVDDDEAVEEWDPGDLVPLSERMLSRRYLTAESAKKFGVCFDRSRRCWFIPITTERGELIGAQYKQVGAVINLPYDVPKSSTLFGLYPALGAGHEVVAVVESPLDVVRLDVAGVPAVATFGTMVSKHQVNLMNRYFRFVVRAFDNDAPGAQADEILANMLRRRGCPSTAWDYDGLYDEESLPAKDPGAVPDDEALLRAWEKARAPRWVS